MAENAECGMRIMEWVDGREKKNTEHGMRSRRGYALNTRIRKGCPDPLQLVPEEVLFSALASILFRIPYSVFPHLHPSARGTISE
jgi:hypothetical protein